MNNISPKRNPITQKKHRREVFWQVFFPLAIGVIAILGLAVWTVLSVQGESVSDWAYISLVSLIIPAMLLSLIPLIIFGALAYGILLLNKNLPPYALRIQDTFVRIRDGVKRGSDRVVEPFLRIQSALAALQSLKRK